MPRPLMFFRWRAGTGEIRGSQVAEYLGAKLQLVRSPFSAAGHDHETCIFVKGQPPEDYAKGSYLDMVDAKERFQWIDSHPDIKLIAVSKTACRCMRKRLNRDDITIIPEHHCNYEREKRDRDEIKRAGVIGNNNAFWGFSEEIDDQFAELGLEFEYRTQYKCRQDAIDFYRGIDIQCVWRPHLLGHDSALRNPLKLENAGSFGIPTVAYPEEDYVAEWHNCYIPARTLPEMFRYVEKLRTDRIYYHDWSQIALERAEQYHIERTSKLYLRLEGVN